jgi:hypothetical protein
MYVIKEYLQSIPGPELGMKRPEDTGANGEV